MIIEKTGEDYSGSSKISPEIKINDVFGPILICNIYHL